MAVISLLFFVSGISGLIYQVVWVRAFGNVFGNTVYSASLIVAVFMLGLGAGGYLVGKWADRQYARRPESLLVVYGVFEAVIGAIGFAVAALLPYLASISALVSSYTRDPNGWYALSASSYAARVAIATLVLTPMTLLMGGTLTLLIRYCVRSDHRMGAWSIALLYGVNTAGAATGAFLTDLVLVPAVGLSATQRIAMLCNVVVGAAAVALAWRRSRSPRRAFAVQPSIGAAPESVGSGDGSSATLAWAGLALALSGFGAMGMEIVWFRHFTVLLGGYRTVFSLLLTVILVGIGAGSLAGGWINRSIARPLQMLMVGEAVLVAATLLGLAGSAGSALRSAEAFAAGQAAVQGGWHWAAEVWRITRPMLLEAGIPALIMGLTFPLANAVVQRAERVVGQRAGLLYLSNTLGAVCGSLTAGFLLLPALGMQASATLLAVASGLTIVPLYCASRAASARALPGGRGSVAVPAASALLSGTALALWLLLPGDFVIARAQAPLPAGQRRLALVEGINEIVAVVDGGAAGRTLWTNDHSMSSTSPAAQRYMRALAHIPLLSMDRPHKALVIGFGVGNTTHAISLHPTIRWIEIADLSRVILEHARYFAGTNDAVLDDPRVAVYVEDGRQHLRMRDDGDCDLITLEPPPIAQAGVGALYSREFYALARRRLTAGGYISQWLPAYQVPPETTLAMIRAFVDVFPQAVLLSGGHQELLLIGTKASAIEIDPEHLAARIADAPAVQADLQRIGLGTITDIVATFVAAPRTLQAATAGRAATTDDDPIQEYTAKSRLTLAYRRLPASVVDLTQVSAWCPRCFADGKPVKLAEGLDLRLASLVRHYDEMSQR